MSIKEITVQELKKKMDVQEDFQLIDVREIFEHEMVNIGGLLMPMATVVDELEHIEKNKPVIVYCRSGVRSANIIAYLESQYGLLNLYNLKGGINAWAMEIDNSLSPY